MSAPNGGRRTAPPEMIVIHDTAGLMPGCLETLMNPEGSVSCHYLITRDGQKYIIVDEMDIAYHAGVSRFDVNDDGDIEKAEENLNKRSIGIELETIDGTYTREQLAALYDLCVDLSLRYTIPTRLIVGHREIAPGRKVDPALDMTMFRGQMEVELVEYLKSPKADRDPNIRIPDGRPGPDGGLNTPPPIGEAAFAKEEPTRFWQKHGFKKLVGGLVLVGGIFVTLPSNTAKAIGSFILFATGSAIEGTGLAEYVGNKKKGIDQSDNVIKAIADALARLITAILSYLKKER